MQLEGFKAGDGSLREAYEKALSSNCILVCDVSLMDSVENLNTESWVQSQGSSLLVFATSYNEFLSHYQHKRGYRFVIHNTESLLDQMGVTYATYQKPLDKF